jgi:hypothetical protein
MELQEVGAHTLGIETSCNALFGVFHGLSRPTST